LDVFHGGGSLLRWLRADREKLVEPKVVDAATLVEVSRLE